MGSPFRFLDVYTYNKKYTFGVERPKHNFPSWIHLAIVYNANENTVKVYQNAETGIWSQFQSSGTSDGSESGHWQIGKHRSTFKITKIDELIFWDRPLTSDQIKVIYDYHDGK